ncbi:MAG: rhodanese-like domain-containing protein [Actinomycetota bacterium]
MSARRVIAALGVAAALVAAGCADDDTTAEPAAAASAEQPAADIVDAIAERTVIDVRTPDEFDAGHVEGALNLDVQDPGFDAAVSELPKDGSYVVYCRSGNRSAAAAARMAELGFTDVVDAGAFESLVAAGVPTA